MQFLIDYSGAGAQYNNLPGIERIYCRKGIDLFFFFSPIFTYIVRVV